MSNGNGAARFLQALRHGATHTGEPHHDVPAFLIAHGHPKTAKHCAAVAREARRIAALVGADADGAERAGWFHDVSAIFPTADRIAAAHALGVKVLPEEAAFPMILHQKLSAVLARELFGERNDAVLSAIGCHTTLKADASTLDTVVFVADKIAWDQPGILPYRDALLAALAHSLDAARSSTSAISGSGAKRSASFIPGSSMPTSDMPTPNAAGNARALPAD